MSINGLEITDVIVFPVKNKVENSSLNAFARVIINDQFTINGIRVFEGKNGPFVRMPQEYNKEAGKGYDICFPTTAELRTYIFDQVLSQYAITMNVKAA
jgi:DNA-binding cell septation regulator SpoVG